MSKAKKQNPPKKPKTSKPVPKDVASGAAFVRDATQKSQGRGKRPTPPDVELGAAFVAELDAENSLPIGLEIGDSGIGGSGQQLAKKEFEQKTRKTNRKQIESAIETLANDPLSFEDALLDMPSHLQNSLRDSCERVFERRQRRDLLGLDLHGLTKRQAIRHVNKWIADHIGDYADASNEQKELVVECFRRIKAELGGAFLLRKGKDSEMVEVTFRCGTNASGKRRFTLCESGGRRSTISQTNGFPEFSLNSD